MSETKLSAIATSLIGVGASLYVASLFGQGHTLERYWWHAVGLGFCCWGVKENKQALEEAWEDDMFRQGDRQILVSRQSQIIQQALTPTVTVQSQPQPQLQPSSNPQLLPEEQPQTSSAPTGEDKLERLVRDKKSTILSAIPGTTKTTLFLAYLSRMHELYPNAEVYGACAKNDSYLGLSEIPGRVKVCTSGKDLVNQIQVVNDILDSRKQVAEGDRDFDHKPVRFFFDDGTYLLNLIKSDKKLLEKFKTALCNLATVGRDFNVGYFACVHSLNLDQLGIEGSDIRDCFNVCSLGFESIDSAGNTAGGYDSLVSVINRKEIVMSSERKTLLQQLPQLIQESESQSRPILFTTLGTAPTLSLLPDLRPLLHQKLDGFDESEVEIEPITCTPPVEPREGQSETCRNLLERLVKDDIEDTVKTELPEHLKLIADYSKKRGWITARDLCRNKSYFKQKSADEVRSFFVDLINLGVGAVRGSDEALEWCLSPSD